MGNVNVDEMVHMGCIQLHYQHSTCKLKWILNEYYIYWIIIAVINEINHFIEDVLYNCDVDTLCYRWVSGLAPKNYSVLSRKIT